MSYTVNSLEEMPNALSYLIKTVEELQSTVKALQQLTVRRPYRKLLISL